MRTVYAAGDHPSFPESVQVTGVTALMREPMVRLAEGAKPHRLPHLAALLIDAIAAADVEPLRLPVVKDQRIARLNAVLRGDPADATSLGGWTARLGMSRRTLIRRIQNDTEMSFRALRRRASRAKSASVSSRRSAGKAAARSPSDRSRSRAAAP